jgi:spore maturation protein CgeB
VRLVVGWCSTGIPTVEPLRGYDIVLTSSPVQLRRYRNEGLRAELLRHAFDPRILDRIDVSIPADVPISFVGNVIRTPGVHDYRAQVVERLIKEFNLSVFAPGYEEHFARTAAKVAAFDLAHLLRRIGVSRRVIDRLPFLSTAVKLEARPLFKFQDPIVRRSQGACYGLAMYQVLARSQATVNVHGEMGGRYTANIRLFEATGAGTCLLTDWMEDLKDLFEPDSEVVSFKSVEECVEKTSWLLEHPEECRQIGEAGHQRTLRDHTYQQRTAELDELFRKAVR